MSEEERRPKRVPRRDRGDDEEFEAIVDQPDVDPVLVDPDVQDLHDAPSFPTLEEAVEDYKRRREEKENHDE
jgi:hypothetical protein